MIELRDGQGRPDRAALRGASRRGRFGEVSGPGAGKTGPLAHAVAIRHAAIMTARRTSLVIKPPGAGHLITVSPQPGLRQQVFPFTPPTRNALSCRNDGACSLL